MRARWMSVWGFSAVMLSLPVFLLLAPDPLSLGVGAFSLGLGVGGYFIISERRVRRHRYGFWIAVEEYGPEKATIVMGLTASISLLLIFGVVAWTSGIPSFDLALPIAPIFLAMLTILAHAVYRNLMRKRRDRDVFFRYIPALPHDVVAAIRSALDSARIEYVFNATGRVEPLEGPTIILREGPRFLVVEGPARNSSCVILKVGEPASQYRPSPAVEALESSLADLDRRGRKG